MPGPFIVKIVPELERELRSNRLRGLRRRIEGKLEELEANADSLGRPLAPPLAGCRRVKLGGTYRLVYTIIGDVVYVLAIASRENDGPYAASTGQRLAQVREEG